jgi:hypothetical protein
MPQGIVLSLPLAGGIGPRNRKAACAWGAAALSFLRMAGWLGGHLFFLRIDPGHQLGSPEKAPSPTGLVAVSVRARKTRVGRDQVINFVVIDSQQLLDGFARKHSVFVHEL